MATQCSILKPLDPETVPVTVGQSWNTGHRAHGTGAIEPAAPGSCPVNSAASSTSQGRVATHAAGPWAAELAVLASGQLAAQQTQSRRGCCRSSSREVTKIERTTVVRVVKLGGKVETVTSIKQCEASLQGLSSEEVQMCLEAEASASTKVNTKTEMKHCNKDTSKLENKNTFSDIFRDRLTEIRGGHTTEPDLLFSANKNPSAYKDWLTTVPQYPDLLSYSLESLHELIPKTDPVRKNLRSAISHYILEKGLWKNCSAPCQAGIKSDSKDSCICLCHNEPAVNTDCCPTRKGMARVIITIQRAFDLWGDHSTATDGYVKVLVNKQLIHRSPVINNNNNPHWENILDLGSQDISSSGIIRFEVWDQDSGWDDDLLGACEQVLTSGMKQDVCALQHGRFYYKWEVKCAPSLGGKSCRDYKPSPMDQSLRKVYTSRHARPIPESILLEMGVFMDESRSCRNLTHN